MTRRSQLTISVVREPSGRRARHDDEPELAPARVKRLRDAALAGLQSEEWGSELGRLFLAGKIGPGLYAAGRRWTECAARYRAALGAPPPHPRAVPLERGSVAAPPDPASEAGRRQAAREHAAIRQLREAQAALREAGTLAERVVRSVCEHDQAPGGVHEREALVRGLQALARFWRMTGVAR
jgi:hypothetical protein